MKPKRSKQGRKRADIASQLVILSQQLAEQLLAHVAAGPAGGGGALRDAIRPGARVELITSLSQPMSAKLLVGGEPVAMVSLGTMRGETLAEHLRAAEARITGGH